MKSLTISLAIAIGLTFSLSSGTLAADKGQYDLYKPDWGPFKAKKAQYKRWQQLEAIAKKDGLGQKNLQERMKILKPIVDRNPGWVDGQWLYANTLMQYGETLSADDEKGKAKTRKYLVQAKDYSKKCLDQKPNHAICKFFYGAAVGKIGTVDGIMSSLGKGKIVLNSWLDVYNSKTNYVFSDGYSLQGLTRYALGIFYRVVPDFFLLRWFFDISGDIDKSVKMHKEAIAFKGGKGPCSQMMYAVAMLCKSEGEKSHPMTGQAFGVLDKIAAADSKGNESAMVCINDAPKLKAKPSDACGYTKAQVQKRDEESLKKENLKNKS